MVEPAEPAPKGSLRAVLTDRSELNSAVASTNDDGDVLLEVGGKSVAIPTSALLVLQLGTIEPEQQDHWLETIEANAIADVLIVRQPGGALTNIEGLVKRINNESVVFEFNQTVVPVPFARLAGIRFFSATAGREFEPLMGILTDRQGGRVNFTSLATPEGNRDSQEQHLVVRSVTGMALTFPFNQIQQIDFGAARSLRLDAIDALSVSSESPFGFPVPELANASSLRVRKLVAHRSSGQKSGLEFLGRSWATFEIPTGYSRASGRVLLAPSADHFTPCTVSLRIEGKLIWSAELEEVDAPVTFDFPVTENDRLQLSVEPQTPLATGCVVHWLDVQFHR